LRLVIVYTIMLFMSQEIFHIYSYEIPLHLMTLCEYIGFPDQLMKRLYYNRTDVQVGCIILNLLPPEKFIFNVYHLKCD